MLNQTESWESLKHKLKKSCSSTKTVKTVYFRMEQMVWSGGKFVSAWQPSAEGPLAKHCNQWGSTSPGTKR